MAHVRIFVALLVAVSATRDESEAARAARLSEPVELEEEVISKPLGDPQTSMWDVKGSMCCACQRDGEPTKVSYSVSGSCSKCSGDWRVVARVQQPLQETWRNGCLKGTADFRKTGVTVKDCTAFCRMWASDEGFTSSLVEVESVEQEDEDYWGHEGCEDRELETDEQIEDDTPVASGDGVVEEDDTPVASGDGVVEEDDTPVASGDGVVEEDDTPVASENDVSRTDEPVGTACCLCKKGDGEEEQKFSYSISGTCSTCEHGVEKKEQTPLPSGCVKGSVDYRKDIKKADCAAKCFDWSR